MLILMIMMRMLKMVTTRHDICQNVYATAVWGARILRRKRVNRDISQFSTKARIMMYYVQILQMITGFS